MRRQERFSPRPLWVVVIAMVLGALDLTGVTRAGEGDNSGAPPLEGTPWALQGLVDDDGQTLPLVADTEITLRFEGGRLQGSGGCNRYFASYEIQDGRLSMGRPGATMMACAQTVMDQEQAFLGALEKAARFEIRDARLVLLDSQGRRLAVFRAATHGSRAPVARPPKLAFDLSRLDAQGLYGPPDGLRSLDYEFCIPAIQAHRDEVRAIDSHIRIHRASPGRSACTECEHLCLGNTQGPNYREILHRLASLPYVRRIVQSHFE